MCTDCLQSPCAALFPPLSFARSRLSICTPPPPAQSSPQPRCYYTFRILRDRPTLPRRRRPAATGGHPVHHGRSGQLSKDKMKVLAVVLVTGGVVITIRYGTVEAVPFTNRTHFITSSASSGSPDSRIFRMTHIKDLATVLVPIFRWTSF
jgi:hypothetical protein